jgi:hypothetical protein
MSQKLKALRFGDQVFDLTGKADLVDGKVPASQLPSYVDDVIEVENFAALPITGEAGKIYITTDNGKIFRWGGSVFVEIPTTPTYLVASGTITPTSSVASGTYEIYIDSIGNLWGRTAIELVIPRVELPNTFVLGVVPTELISFLPNQVKHVGNCARVLTDGTNASIINNVQEILLEQNGNLITPFPVQTYYGASNKYYFVTYNITKVK